MLSTTNLRKQFFTILPNDALHACSKCTQYISVCVYSPRKRKDSPFVHMHVMQINYRLCSKARNVDSGVQCAHDENNDNAVWGTQQKSMPSYLLNRLSQQPYVAFWFQLDNNATCAIVARLGQSCSPAVITLSPVPVVHVRSAAPPNEQMHSQIPPD